MTYATPVSIPVAQAEQYDSDRPVIVVANDNGLMEEGRSTAPTTVYVIQRDVERPDVYDETGLSCALIGLCFSWIPIIGLLTYLFNCYSPRGSLTYRYSVMALYIAFISMIFNIIFWSVASGNGYGW